MQRNVDWKAYFKKISNVCPWSLEAYDNGEIQFFEDDLAIRDLGNNKALLNSIFDETELDYQKLSEECNYDVEDRNTDDDVEDRNIEEKATRRPQGVNIQKQQTVNIFKFKMYSA